MRLRDHERTSSPILQVRVLRRLAQAAPGELVSAATLGAAGWPTSTLKAQGLAFSIGPTLAKLRRDGLVVWRCFEPSRFTKVWGWELTPKGVDTARSL